MLLNRIFLTKIAAVAAEELMQGLKVSFEGSLIGRMIKWAGKRFLMHKPSG